MFLKLTERQENFCLMENKVCGWKVTQSIKAPHFTFYFKCSCSGPDRGFTEHSGETEERTEEKERQGELFTGRSG